MTPLLLLHHFSPDCSCSGIRSVDPARYRAHHESVPTCLESKCSQTRTQCQHMAQVCRMRLSVKQVASECNFEIVESEQLQLQTSESFYADWFTTFLKRLIKNNFIDKLCQKEQIYFYNIWCQLIYPYFKGVCFFRCIRIQIHYYYYIR